MNTPSERDFYVDLIEEDAKMNRNALVSSDEVAHEHDQLAHMTYQTVVRNKHQEFEEAMSLLVMELLKWKFLKERRANSLKRIIKKHRIKIPEMLDAFPSLEMHLFDVIWLERVWKTAVLLLEHVTQLRNFFPEKPLWTIGEIIDMHFFPD